MTNPTDNPWFYAPELPKAGEVLLDPEETRHMRAQRLNTEEKVSLFNGKGVAAIGAITNEGKVKLLEAHEVPKNDFSLAIAVAVPKGDRADWMLQKLTELGVSTIKAYSQGRSWDYLGMSWDYPGNVLRRCWDYPGNEWEYLGLSWDYRKIYVTTSHSQTFPIGTIWE